MDLNTKWTIITAEGEHMGDLPYDALAGAARDFTCAYGELNGYIPAAHATFVKNLPIVRHGKAYIAVSGACGYGDVFVNDNAVGKLTTHAPAVFDVTDLLTGTHNTLRIDMFAAPGMSDKYTGLGIGGGVKLITEESIDIVYDSLHVKSATVGDRTYADAVMTVRNDSDARVKLVLDCAVTNLRGKRCGKRQRKVYVRAHSQKEFIVRVRLTRAYEWTVNDPYLYNMTARIITPEGEERTASTEFGLASYALNAGRGLYVNGRHTVLCGAYVSHADAMLGGVSVYCNEKRRFEALKAVGYNAVRFTECPTEAALKALDDVGMYAYVDIYGALLSGKAPLDSHALGFSYARCVDSVRALRTHPCVVMYGVADDAPECYGRSGGHELIADLARIIRSEDDTRPVTVSAREFVPTAKELENAGVRKRAESDTAAINAGREKDLFDTLTDGAFGSVDVCGFNYLYPMYSTERVKHGRFIVGSRTDPDRAFESVEEMYKNPNVIGDFSDCGMDYPGGGKLNEIVCAKGDIDAIGDEKTQGVYKRIILGARGAAHIAALDPDTEEPTEMWNWPRYLGQPITVKVYTSGDVVALYLDGRLIGRKLAGKINKHTSTFTVDYYPGTLEAVCYFKGVECARAQLKTVGSPKLVRLSAYDKNLSMSRGDIGFVHVDVCDKEGNLVPYAMRTLNVQVTGGKLVGFINADPMLRKTAFDSCPAYNGKACCAVKPDGDAKVIVKITGDGLLASKISFKVKD